MKKFRSAIKTIGQALWAVAVIMSTASLIGFGLAGGVWAYVVVFVLRKGATT